MVAHSTPRSLFSSLSQWFRQERGRHGTLGALKGMSKVLLQFLRESTPENRRRRYGDAEYDWDFHVDTTSATVGWRERLLGGFHSPYQPTEPGLFDEMMTRLPADLSQFAFIDVGSGKGRVLLMAARYQFLRIIGIELMPELHRVAVANVEKLRALNQLGENVELLQMDATEYVFPAERMVIYLFNPLPEESLKKFLARLSQDLDAHPRDAYIVYHNPLLAHVVESNERFVRIDCTAQYVLYRTELTG